MPHRLSRRAAAVIALASLSAIACHNPPSSAPRATAATAPPLRVMTFNIRYDNPADGVNAWPNRKDWVAALVRFHGADVVGVQEALAHMLTDLDARLPGFARVGVGRTDGRTKGEFSAILYRTDRLALARQRHVLALTDAADGGQQGVGRRHRARGDVGAVPRSPHRVQPSAPEHALRPHGRAGAPGERAAHPPAAGGRSPANCRSWSRATSTPMPSSVAYRTLTRDTIAGAVAPLADAFATSRTGHYGPTSTWTAFRAIEPGRRIDYILVSAPVTVLTHGILPDIWDGRFPSDHLPVLASVETCR